MRKATRRVGPFMITYSAEVDQLSASEMMLNQKLPSRHQSKGPPGLENHCLRSASLKKRTHRRLLIVIAIIASTVALLYFPPRTVLYTWTSETAQSVQDSRLGYSSVTGNLKDGSRDWRSESYVVPSQSFSNYYRPKTNPQFDKVLDDTKESHDFPTPSSRQDQGLDAVDTEPRESEILEQKEAVPMFDRLVVKEAPKKPYRPLPAMRVRPDLQYENVRPSVHYLTRELESTKFLTFLPHSGFHNQRIELKNAFKVAKLLNRTLILPPFRLGDPLRWANSTSLGQAMEQDERKYERSEDCLKLFSDGDSLLEEHAPILLEECKYDSDWTSVQVDYMLDIKELCREVPIIDRTDLREDWLWNTLNLYPGEWLEVKDEFRYSYQIYESSTASSMAESKYEWRLNIDDLASFSDTRLLSFGSLFGSERVILSSPEMEHFDQKIEANQLPNLPLLEKISDRIADRLGGRGQYIGIHLRVANAFFKVQAPQVIREIFDKLCKEILELDQRTIGDLIAQNESPMTRELGNVNYGPEKLVINEEPSEAVKRSPLDLMRTSEPSSPKTTFNRRPTAQRLECKGRLYGDETGIELLKLNVPIYISTDLPSKTLEDKKALSILFASFPCVFSSNDLELDRPKTPEVPRGKLNKRDQPLGRKKLTSPPSDPSPSNGLAHQTTPDILENHFSSESHHDDSDDPVDDDEDWVPAFHQLKSNLDGMDLDRFLFPMLESMIVSKGSHFIGTPRSTFSSYIETVLHPAYQRAHKFPQLTTNQQS